MAKSWTVADAKARLSEVIDCAIESGPQLVTRHGKPAAVIVAADEWQAKAGTKNSLVEFFMGSPLRGSGMKIRPPKGSLRRVKL